MSTKTKVKKKIIPARILIDVHPDTGQEYAYEYKGKNSWLNLVTELYHDQDFIDLIKWEVIRVDFGTHKTMTGREWMENDFPFTLEIKEGES